MTAMTGKERIGNILRHQPVDRIGLFEHFWDDTNTTWAAQGHLQPGDYPEKHFGFDLHLCWDFNPTADLRYVPETISEDDETIVQKDGNGAILRRHKQHDSTPEHVDFTVKSRKEWEAMKPLLTASRERIDFERYRGYKRDADANGRFFMLSGPNVFELMHPVCGHENLLMGMIDDPEWIEDMVDTYSRMLVELQEMLFAEEGYPDGLWYYEDMGFKERPFMSPAMYRAFIQPGHARTIDFAHSHQLPVIMHSCGYVEPLLPGMLEAGIDCLQVIEVKAGMDLLRIHQNFGDKIALCGGIDVRTLYSNDRTIIDAELEAKIPFVKEGFGYILHSDHSIPNTVEYDTYRYFIQRGLELGTY